MCIGAIKIYVKSLDVHTYCTGFLVANNLVVTSAHALYPFFEGKYYQGELVTFYPGLNGEVVEEKGVRIENYRVRG